MKRMGSLPSKLFQEVVLPLSSVASSCSQSSWSKSSLGWLATFQGKRRKRLLRSKSRLRYTFSEFALGLS